MHMPYHGYGVMTALGVDFLLCQWDPVFKHRLSGLHSNSFHLLNHFTSQSPSKDNNLCSRVHRESKADSLEWEGFQRKNSAICTFSNVMLSLESIYFFTLNTLCVWTVYTMHMVRGQRLTCTSQFSFLSVCVSQGLY